MHTNRRANANSEIFFVFQARMELFARRARREAKVQGEFTHTHRMCMHKHLQHKHILIFFCTTWPGQHCVLPVKTSSSTALSVVVALLPWHRYVDVVCMRQMSPTVAQVGDQRS